MKINNHIQLSALLLSLIISTNVLSSTQPTSDLLALQQQWAKVNYTMENKAQAKGFEDLVLQANNLVESNPKSADALIWLGIVKSSYAGAKGGLGALGLVKEAKNAFEQALAIDDTALDGSAYTSLGTLYHKVPGWPIGFGDDDDAKMLLEKALMINPTGIDTNYFYGEFLFDEKDYVGAKKYLSLALAAPNRPHRSLADESRRAEIANLMAKVDKKLTKKNS
ncbi:hypothetical protein KJ365_00270 [Glaciecola sp. XM2]|uniref:tetratricopeptide repeat protein n=1 Tax=Glaciecola sp. XM2 TaxID=1914931 RepID=UPI001BDEEA15|nr:hypothetical protein [Glaciecola sp. XM2]MBT1449299.1 hypothetical protein [Glaciecola sp. XM2]